MSLCFLGNILWVWFLQFACCVHWRFVCCGGMWGVLGWCGLVEEVDVVYAVGGEVDGAGSGLGGDSVCVCEVLVDGYHNYFGVSCLFYVSQEIF